MTVDFWRCVLIMRSYFALLVNDVCDRHGVLADKLEKKGRLLTKSANFLPAEEIDANVKFEVFVH